MAHSPAPSRNRRPIRLLLYTRTMQYAHQSIPSGIHALQGLSARHDFVLTESQDPEVFRSASLDTYNAVVFFNTSGDVLDDEGKDALQRYVRAGRGIIGIHGAAATMQGWDWYVHLIGGTFTNHPEVQLGRIHTVDSSHPATAHLPEVWEWEEEWYNFQRLAPDLHILLRVDESSYAGGELGVWHPIAWTHEVEGSRVFYTGIGHQPEAFTDPRVIRHLLGGIRHVTGLE